VPFLHVTTYIEGRKGDNLLSKKMDDAKWPTVMILDGTGEPLLTITRADASLWGRAGMPVSVYAKKLDACERYVALAKRAAAGDKSVKVDLAVAGVRIGKLKLAALDKAVAGVKLTPEQAKVVAQARVNAICDRLVARTVGRYIPEEQKRIADALIRIYRAGTHPTSDSRGTYWWVVAKRGQETGDIAMMEDGRRGIRASPGGGWQLQGFLDQLEADLEARKAGSDR
jgi:hypothetical protein